MASAQSSLKSSSFLIGDVKVDFTSATPAIFVLLWSTGFIGARYGLPYAGPFAFLAVRWLIAAALMISLVLILRWDWPRDLTSAGHSAVAGLLLQAGYLVGVFYAMSRGMSAGLAALVVGLQPVLVAAMAQRTLGERVYARQWFGLALGFGGVAIVVVERMRINGGLHGSTRLAAVIAILIGLFSATIGSVYQKRFCSGIPVVSGTAIQYCVSGLAMVMLAWTSGVTAINWHPRFIFALAWQVLVLSVLAVTLLMFLIRQNSVSRISSYLYLVPPLTALEAWVLFDEQMSLITIGGMVVVAMGVLLVIRKSVAPL